MATDVEESDTDDHERPVPPKRQCTRFFPVAENIWDPEKLLIDKEEPAQDVDNIEYDDVEKQAREKLKKWQAYQVTKGFLDNAINRALENFIWRPPSSYSWEESQFHLFRGNDMEDTAVTMAIRNHGLVQSTELVSQSNAFYSDMAPGYWTNNDYSEGPCSCPSTEEDDVSNYPNSVATTSANSLRLSTSSNVQDNVDWDADKVDTNQQEDFLERAVAEAIKKKGLSALSVDYG